MTRNDIAIIAGALVGMEIVRLITRKSREKQRQTEAELIDRTETMFGEWIQEGQHLEWEKQFGAFEE